MFLISHDQDNKTGKKKKQNTTNRWDTKKKILLLLKEIISLKLSKIIKTFSKAHGVYLKYVIQKYIEIELHTRPCSAAWQLSRDVVQTELLKGLIMEKCSSWNRTKRGILHPWLPASLLLLCYILWNQLEKLDAPDCYRLLVKLEKKKKGLSIP